MLTLSSTTLLSIVAAVVIAAWLLRRLRRLVQLAMVVALVTVLPDLLRGQIPAWAITVWRAVDPVVAPAGQAFWTWLRTMIPL